AASLNNLSSQRFAGFSCTVLACSKSLVLFGDFAEGFEFGQGEQVFRATGGALGDDEGVEREHIALQAKKIHYDGSGARFRITSESFHLAQQINVAQIGCEGEIR